MVKGMRSLQGVLGSSVRRQVCCLLVGVSLLLYACRPPDRTDSRPAGALEQDAYGTVALNSYGLPIDAYRVDSLRIPMNSNLATIFRSHGVAGNHLAQLGVVLDSVFPARRIRAGNLSMFFSDTDSVPSYWVYHHTPTDYLFLDFTADTLRAYTSTLPVKSWRSSAHFKITSSLWNAVRDAGVPPSLALKLSDIYAWTVDFFGLAQGDEFFVSFERRSCNGAELEAGEIHCARYISGRDTVNAYRFMQDSVYSYWDAAGNSLRKAFLKAPLHFSRISSHFTYARKHPILKIVRPHTGIDYAAPHGTPVLALGDGVVVGKGYQGGGGNFVKIRHNSVYTTGYLHLSRFGKGIAPGVRVQQGQVIGYVGSTGMATGPHLDFRVWKSGHPMNPLHLESPSVEPIDSASRPAFELAVHQQDSILRHIVRLEPQPDTIE